ncbi:MAG: carbohydrate kinase family protein [Bacteroidales bacterium]
MSRIYTIGETVLDLIFENHTLRQAVPGGAMLNTAVSLGRLKLPVALISEWGKDVAGQLIADFLIRQQVDIQLVHVFEQGKTALSLASLDAAGHASYTFYKDYPSQRLKITPPDFQPGDVVLFGSYFALDPAIRTPLVALLRQARQQQALLIYDPNIRKNHSDELEELLPDLQENFNLAHIVRGSHEDFLHLLGTHDPYEVFQTSIQWGCDHLIMTHAEGEIIFRKPMVSTSIEAYPAQIVSTIGAGDTFNAGLIYALYTRGISAANYRDMPSCEWGDILSVASAFAANACESYENYISEAFARQILHSNTQ